MSDDEDQDRLVLKGCFIFFALVALLNFISLMVLASALSGIPFFSLF